MSFAFLQDPLNDKGGVVSSAIGSVMVGLNLGSSGFGMSTDSDPSLISDVAKSNINGHFPAGGTQKQVMHFRQLVRTGNFEQFDYGPEVNKLRYGNSEVRPFNFDAIQNKVALFCGKTDLLASPMNYRWLETKLSNAGALHLFKEYELGHMGLIMPKDKTIFQDILNVIRECNKEGN